MKKKLLSSILLVCILVSSCSIAPNTTISNTETSLETLTETFPIETNVSTTESKLTETNEITKIPSNIFLKTLISYSFLPYTHYRLITTII